jgi:hypothetical protein
MELIEYLIFEQNHNKTISDHNNDLDDCFYYFQTPIKLTIDEEILYNEFNESFATAQQREKNEK